MRLAIVTGGSKGLGLALCERLVAHAYHVLELSRGAPHPYSVRADLSSPEESLQALREAIEPLDRGAVNELLVISNAATLGPIGPASRKSPAEVLDNLNTNFVSAILLLAGIVNHFQGTSCRKVLANISTGAARHAYAGWSLYCAAKAGMEHHIRALALEQQMEQHPFLPINIVPGVFDTDMQALIRASPAAEFPEVERFVRRKEQGELRRPVKVAEAVYRICQLPTLSSGGSYDVSDYLS